jgi:hypothetical protein
MRMKIQITILSITAAGAVFFWFTAAQTGHQADKNYAAQLDRKRELQAEIAKLEKRATQPELPSTVSPAPAKTTTATGNSPAQQQAARQRLLGGMTFYSKELATDPNLQRLDLERHRARIALEYDEFFEAVGLSPTQIERFQATVLKQVELSLDLRAMGQAQNAEEKRAMAAFQQQTEATHEIELQQTLGPDLYRALQEYESAQYSRTAVVNSFAGTAALAGVPLTPEQGDQLLQAALSATKAPSAAAAPDLRSSIDLAKLDAQAREILTPAQFEVFLHGNSHRKMVEGNAVMAKVREAEEARRE